MICVALPSPLFSYTGGEAHVACEAADLADLLGQLEARYPGVRFRMVDEQQRIRPHIRIFADGAPLRQLDAGLEGTAEVLIVAALSGG
jgi:molybdopterin converting factor small subunit